jgi:hypothetical protein
MLRPISDLDQDLYSEAAAGLAAELDDAGFTVDRLGELRRRDVGDRRALPALLNWFHRATFASLRGDIAYVLASRWAQPEGLRALLDEYHRIDGSADPSDRMLRAAICTSLERVADNTVLDELIAIARDKTHGTNRGMAIVALGNMRSEARQRALDTLLGLLEDDDVVLFALLGLVKMDAREALRPIIFLTRHRNPIVAKVAVRTVARWTA